MKHLIIKAEREHYDVSEVSGITVAELIEELERCDPKSIVAIQTDASDVYCGVHIAGDLFYPIFPANR